VNKVGFWSGFQPVNVVLENPPQFSITINDTEPIFFYCSAPGACIQEGMIGVINPNSTQTLDVQLAYAKNSTLMFSPGQGYPSETTTSTASPTSSPSSSSKQALSSGGIAGIVLGDIAIIALVGIFCFMYRRKKKRAGQIGDASQDPPFDVLDSPSKHPDCDHRGLSRNSAQCGESISPKSYMSPDLLAPGLAPNSVPYEHPLSAQLHELANSESATLFDDSLQYKAIP